MTKETLKRKKPVLFILLFSGSVLLLFLIMQPLEIRYGGKLIAILFPKGEIALKERNLLLIIQGLMLLIVIPVYILTFAFSWFYRADNPKGKYTPDLTDSWVAEIIWWGLPLIITVIIGGLTIWQTYHLDPFRPLNSEKKPLKIQVVALQWRWLFLYPEQKIATLNFVQFPEKTPLHFEITADAPMNSFWIPQLGGQIYAMPKMTTQLHLIADHTGEYRGCSANISGAGFSKMHFIAKATSDEEFENWVEQSKNSTLLLDKASYEKLSLPNDTYTLDTYQLKDENLFQNILMKFMHPPPPENL